MAHLVSALVAAFLFALFGWTAGFSAWAVLAYYILGGTLGLVASAVAPTLIFKAPWPSKDSGDMDGSQ